MGEATYKGQGGYAFEQFAQRVLVTTRRHLLSSKVLIPSILLAQVSMEEHIAPGSEAADVSARMLSAMQEDAHAADKGIFPPNYPTLEQLDAAFYDRPGLLRNKERLSELATDMKLLVPEHNAPRGRTADSCQLSAHHSASRRSIPRCGGMRLSSKGGLQSVVACMLLSHSHLHALQQLRLGRWVGNPRTLRSQRPLQPWLRNNSQQTLTHTASSSSSSSDGNQKFRSRGPAWVR